MGYNVQRPCLGTAGGSQSPSISIPPPFFSLLFSSVFSFPSDFCLSRSIIPLWVVVDNFLTLFSPSHSFRSPYYFYFILFARRSLDPSVIFRTRHSFSGSHFHSFPLPIVYPQLGSHFVGHDTIDRPNPRIRNLLILPGSRTTLLTSV